MLQITLHHGVIQKTDEKISTTEETKILLGAQAIQLVAAKNR